MGAGLRHPVAGHVLPIDDMRDFLGRDGYPKIERLVEWIRETDPLGVVDVRDDILRWCSGRTPAARRDARL